MQHLNAEAQRTQRRRGRKGRRENQQPQWITLARAHGMAPSQQSDMPK